MKLLLLKQIVILLGVFLSFSTALAQLLSPNDNAIRVNVTVNPDGSRTTYRFDQLNRQATATTTGLDGKARGKIQYTLDDAGRFATSESFSPDGKFRFKSTYKYDGAGRIEEEKQLTRTGELLSKITYSYDSAGRQISYSIFDGAGKLLNRVSAPSAPSAAPSAKAHK